MAPSIVISTYEPMLQQIAYRLLRCKADAEDVVQETLVRWMESNQQKIRDTKAYLIRSVTNNCFSQLEKKRITRTSGLPEEGQKGFLNYFTEINLSSIDLDQQLKGAFDLLHSRLEPLERAIYLLRTAFNVDYQELSELFDRNADHCRKLFSRANKKLEMPTISIKGIPAPGELLESFKKACQVGNPSDLVQKLLSSIPSKELN